MFSTVLETKGFFPVVWPWLCIITLSNSWATFPPFSFCIYLFHFVVITKSEFFILVAVHFIIFFFYCFLLLFCLPRHDPLSLFLLSPSHCAIVSLGTPASSSCQLRRRITDWHAIKGPPHALAHAGNEFPQSLIKVTITLQPRVFPINLLFFPPSLSREHVFWALQSLLSIFILIFPH